MAENNIIDTLIWIIPLYGDDKNEGVNEYTSFNNVNFDTILQFMECIKNKPEKLYNIIEMKIHIAIYGNCNEISNKPLLKTILDKEDSLKENLKIHLMTTDFDYGGKKYNRSIIKNIFDLLSPENTNIIVLEGHGTKCGRTRYKGRDLSQNSLLFLGEFNLHIYYLLDQIGNKKCIVIPRMCFGSIFVQGVDIPDTCDFIIPQKAGTLQGNSECSVQLIIFLLYICGKKLNFILKQLTFCKNENYTLISKNPEKIYSNIDIYDQDMSDTLIQNYLFENVDKMEYTQKYLKYTQKYLKYKQKYLNLKKLNYL